MLLSRTCAFPPKRPAHWLSALGKGRTGAGGSWEKAGVSAQAGFPLCFSLGARPQEMLQQSRSVIPGGLIKRPFAMMWAGMGKSWAKNGNVPTLGWKRGGRVPETQQPREYWRGAPGGRGTASPREPVSLLPCRALWGLPFGQSIQKAVGQPQGRELGQEGGKRWANRRN